jgi:hypothetical protein
MVKLIYGAPPFGFTAVTDAGGQVPQPGTPRENGLGFQIVSELTAGSSSVTLTFIARSSHDPAWNALGAALEGALAQLQAARTRADGEPATVEITLPAAAMAPR